MNKIGLTLISEIMGWNDPDVATREFNWLRLMAATKYDGYSDFRAGSRFVENLAIWLKQFDQEDRGTAYDFVKNRLVYISAAEMQRLIEAFVPETVTIQATRSDASWAKLEASVRRIWDQTPEGAEKTVIVLDTIRQLRSR